MARRTVIRLDSMALAMSLSARLNQIPGTGQRGVGSLGEGLYEVVLDEFPRRSEQVTGILDAVGAWLDEVGHQEVTVEFRWHLKRSGSGTTRAQQPVLYWKQEDGPADAGSDGSLDDVGPAWLQTQDARGTLTSEPINDGEWISRIDVLMIARANGYTVRLDD